MAQQPSTSTTPTPAEPNQFDPKCLDVIIGEGSLPMLKGKVISWYLTIDESVQVQVFSVCTSAPQRCL
jgi:hypothetical protein